MMDSYGKLLVDGNEISGVVDEVTDGNMHPVTSNAVYDALGSGGGVDIDTSFPSSPSDTHVPSTKLVKNSLDAKASTSDIPVNTSDLVNDGEDGTNVFIDESDSRLTDARTPTSHTHTKSEISDFPTSMTPTSHASSSSSYGLGTTSAYGHNLLVNNLTLSSHHNGMALSAYQGYVLKGLIDAKSDFSGSYNDLDDVPSTFTPSSHTHSISDVTNLQTSLDAKVNTSDIANNLTTTTSGKVLDARQGKALADLIGDAIVYINQ